MHLAQFLGLLINLSEYQDSACKELMNSAHSNHTFAFVKRFIKN